MPFRGKLARVKKKFLNALALSLVFGVFIMYREGEANRLDNWLGTIAAAIALAAVITVLVVGFQRLRARLGKRSPS